MPEGVLGGITPAPGTAAGTALHPPLRGPVSLAQASLPWCRTLQIAASWPIRARLRVISPKVSQNGQVSPKSSEKASRSPYFQNGLGKSPLDISRIPFLLAFSHKELMAHFSRWSRLLVKMTKCRPDVHPNVREVDGQIPPPDPATSCSWGRAPHLTSRGQSPDILNGPVL